jgi:pimeloyl-ACP methyl ester carboxylesterase
MVHRWMKSGFLWAAILACAVPPPIEAQLPVSTAPASTAPVSTAPTIQGQDHFAVRDGIRIHLWQKCLKGQETAAAQAGRVALLLHGATWSGKPDFDLQIRDYSLMDFLVRNGYDVWAIDIHGYGQSDRTDKDWSDTASAAEDMAAAVDYICQLRKTTRVKVLGWSWGTQIAGIYAADHPDRISRLILYGNVWHGLPEWKTIPVPKAQYRTNSDADAREDFIAGQFETDVADAYAKEALKTDPQSPNGILVDLFTKLPLIDPEKITVPTLIIRPEKDFASTPEEMLAFFGKLKSPDKAYVCLPEGGHAIILEKGHHRFQNAVLAFFEGERP